jgi:hypothetical protein
MPVCIAGMHRSGTSMITHLLHQCGLFLGPDERDYMVAASDNPEGFWEHSHFLQLNHEILDALRGGWDFPPALPAGWELEPALVPFRARGAELVRQFDGYEPWGWKDPRNSLTFAFWKLLLPNLKVVICVRNPLEVIQSLQKRGYASFAFGENLWLDYNRRVLAAVRPDDRVITHTEAYFVDPAAELRRVLSLLGIQAADATIGKACATISRSMRHHRTTAQEMLAAGISDLTLKTYMDLCAEAGPVYQKVLCPPPEQDLRTTGPAIGYREALQIAGLYTQLAEFRQAALIHSEEQNGIIRTLEARLASRRYEIADQVAAWYQPLWRAWQRLQKWTRRWGRMGTPLPK